MINQLDGTDSALGAEQPRCRATRNFNASTVGWLASVKRVLIPFDLPVFRGLNSNHPLPTSLLQPKYDGIEFVRARQEEDAPAASTARRVYQAAAALADKFRRTAPVSAGLETVVMKFIESRSLQSQLYVDPSVDVAFFHTSPVHLDQLPWILHVESITTLFTPMLLQGAGKGVALREQPVFWFVRALLESELCRGIFTNLSFTKRQIDEVFRSEHISHKTRHIPAGPYFTERQAADIASAVSRKREKKVVEILFTNSWHQGWGNFMLRGGLELVLAFLEIEKSLPHARLILRTIWPEPLKGSDLERRVRSNPKITLIEEPLAEQEMVELFARADIFALDAVSLHSVSVLRAMFCGAASVVSDAPGYDEYLKDGHSGIVLPGLREAVYSVDAGSGWLRDDFSVLSDIQRPRAKDMANALRTLCTDAPLRLSLGMNARRDVQEYNLFADWHAGFESLLRQAIT